MERIRDLRVLDTDFHVEMVIPHHPSSIIFYHQQQYISGNIMVGQIVVRSLFWVSILAYTANARKTSTQKQLNEIVLTRDLVKLCTGKSPIGGKRMETQLKWMVIASGEASVTLKSSAQHKAACWMLYEDKLSKSRKEDLFLQRYALATLHYATTKGNTTAWDWPMAVDEPWAIHSHGDWLHKTKHECQWYGVHCTAVGHKIYQLDLGYLKLDGLIPRELYLLDHLRDIDLHANDFQGVVPHKFITSMVNLEYLRLHMNGFFGSLQKEIANMKNLKELNLFGNYFGGTIPKEIATMKNLERIDLYANQFDGTIPSELGKLKKLRFFDAHDNNLIGTVPQELCKLKLDELIVDCLGPRPEVRCDCCTVCCSGLPEFKCVDQKTGKEIKLKDASRSSSS